MPQLSHSSNNKEQDISRFKSLLDDLKRRFSSPLKTSLDQSTLIASITSQRLYLLNNQKLTLSYPISSAQAGIGNLSGSYKTPLGIHRISEKFGDNATIATIFKGRKNTHTTAEILKKPDSRSEADNITSRILWLDGIEDGINHGTDKDGNSVDSHSRYIYIHGTDEEGLLGKAASHGCIRMANQDVIDLFGKVEIGCLVVITEL